MSSLISVHDLSYHHPNGIMLFEHLSFNLQSQKIGLVGCNGTGKSTLLKLITGELSPSRGNVIVHGKISYLPQKIQSFLEQTVSEILNVNTKLNALNSITNDAWNENHFNIIGDDWNLETEIFEMFSDLQLDHIKLERYGHSLSGGELTRVLLARMFLEKPDLILLDEPTNNLDLNSRIQFYDAINLTKSGMLIISHDRTLLNQMDTIIELSNLGLKNYGGNFDFYCLERQKETLAAINAAQSIDEALKKQIKIEHEMLNKQSHKSAEGKKRAIRSGMSTIEMRSKIASAQKTSARLKQIHEDKTAGLKAKHEEAKLKLRDNSKLIIDVMNVNIPAKKEMIFCKNLNFRFSDCAQNLWRKDINIEIRGNARIAISGANGSGKTTFISLITKKIFPTKGEIRIGTENIVVLDQLCSLIDDNLSVLENLKHFSPPDMQEHEIRICAGRFLFYGDKIFKRGFNLSGGERLRAALACLLGMNNSPDILVLDEPTNNLDLESIEILKHALNEYNGCLLVVSHDVLFLKELNLNEEIVF